MTPHASHAWNCPLPAATRAPCPPPPMAREVDDDGARESAWGDARNKDDERRVSGQDNDGDGAADGIGASGGDGVGVTAEGDGVTGVGAADSAEGRSTTVHHARPKGMAGFTISVGKDGQEEYTCTVEGCKRKGPHNKHEAVSHKKRFHGTAGLKLPGSVAPVQARFADGVYHCPRCGKTSNDTTRAREHGRKCKGPPSDRNTETAPVKFKGDRVPWEGPVGDHPDLVGADDPALMECRLFIHQWGFLLCDDHGAILLKDIEGHLKGNKHRLPKAERAALHARVEERAAQAGISLLDDWPNRGAHTHSGTGLGVCCYVQDSGMILPAVLGPPVFRMFGCAAVLGCSFVAYTDAEIRSHAKLV
ncbi:hypothetical protein DFJ74DRAFT_304233 [Hyaloraphidium curvatum]|nr:hypothetical protein DFJ74DRAFT_304233 [Hyaloraphidium curvatum]